MSLLTRGAMFYVISLHLLLSNDPQILLEEASSAFQQDQHKEAIPKFEQAISLLNSQTDQKEIADASYKLGISYVRTARNQEAIESLQKAFTMHEQLGDTENSGFDLTILGYAYVNMSKYDEAVQTQEKA